MCAAGGGCARFVVQEQRLLAHRSVLSARCEHFRELLSDDFWEDDNPVIHIQGNTSAAFQALLRYLRHNRTFRRAPGAPAPS